MNTETIVKLTTLITSKTRWKTIPVLNSVAINGHITATDLETSIKLPLGAFEGLNGCYYLGKTAVSEANCKLVDGVPISHLCCLEEMPYMPSVADTQPIASIDRLELIKALTALIPAVCTDETRYNICGIYCDNGKFVATDGHRMHIYNLGKFNWQGIIPISSARVILAALKMTDSRIVALMHADRGFIVIAYDGVEVGFKPIDGQYPNYASIYPNSSPTLTFNINHKMLSKAIKGLPVTTRLLDTSNKKGKSKLVTSKASIIVRSHDGLTAQLSYKLEKIEKPIDSIDVIGLSKEFAVDLAYLLDSLKPMGVCPCISIIRDDVPMLIVDDKLTALIMPVRFK